MEIFKKGECIILLDDRDINDTYFFNSIDYYLIHKSCNTLRLNFKYSSNLIATICLHIKNTDLVSPIKATFGGIQFIENSDISEIDKTLDTFQSYVSSVLMVKNIILTMPPLFYSSQESTLTNILLKKNYLLLNNDLNHFIRTESCNSLFEKMNITTKKKFKRLSKLDLIFKESIKIKNSYDLLKKNRLKKGVNISMTYSQLNEMKIKFPDKFIVFDLLIDEKLIASTVCVSINKNVLYVFYWGHDDRYDKITPIVFLAEKVFQFAKKKDYKILDIGTSSLNGIIDKGLKRFKDSLGFSNQLKLTFKKEL